MSCITYWTRTRTTTCRAQPLSAPRVSLLAATCMLLLCAACGEESGSASPSPEPTDAGMDTNVDASPDAQRDAQSDAQSDGADQFTAPEPVQPGVYPLWGLEPTLPTADLEPFGEIFGSASVVALGENVHTSGGFSQVKVRLIRYLIEEHGYRVVAFETPRTDAEGANTYVQTCQGTPKEALEHIFGVWANEATAGLMQWMCTWNQEHPSDPLLFLGFDVQQPWNDGPAAKQFLVSVGGTRGRPWEMHSMCATVRRPDPLKATRQKIRTPDLPSRKTTRLAWRRLRQRRRIWTVVNRRS